MTSHTFNTLTFNKLTLNKLALGLASLGVSTLTQAHITLEQTSAPANSYYKAVFKVGHGCDGSPVEAITVTLPKDVGVPKPMPKAGWKHQVSVASSATISNTVTWSGGSLADGDYDEFVLNIKLPEMAQTLYFPVVQTCAKGSIAWDQTPSVPVLPGELLKRPAPVLSVRAAQKSASAHAHH